jgi:hypothetical protein
MTHPPPRRPQPTGGEGIPPRAPRGLRALLADRGVRLALVGAVAVRLVVGASLWTLDPLTRHPLSDAAFYDRWARALADGGSFQGELPYWLPPLYPWLLSVLYRVSGGALLATVALQLAVGAGATLLLVALCERAAGRAAGIAAAWLWTLYLPVAFLETRLLAVNAALPLALGALLALQSAERRLASGAAAGVGALAAGVLCGLAALARPNLLFAAPFVALAWLATRRARALAPLTLLGAGLLAALSPALVHNRRTADAWLPVTANGGLNFWFGNNALARGTFHAPGPEWGSIDAQREVSLALASEALGREVGDAEAGRWWAGEGRRYLAEHPLDAARLWALKLADTLSSTELGIQYVPAASRELAPPLWIAALPFGALLALAALGWSGPANGRAALVAWLAAGVAASLLYFTYSRFRLPLLPALMPFAGRGAVRLLRDRRAFGSASAVSAALLFAQSFVPFEGDYPRWLRSNSFVDAAAAFAREGAGERQRAALERALELRPDNPKALTELGLALRPEDPRRALELFERAAATGFDHPPAKLALCQDLLAGPLLERRDPARAEGILREWLAARGPEDPFRSAMSLLLAAALAAKPDPTARAEAGALVDLVLAREPANRAALALREALGR